MLAFIFLFYPEVIDAAIALVFVGVIPFTAYTIPMTVMFAIYAVLLLVGVITLKRQLDIAYNPRQREVASRNRARTIIQKKSVVTNKKKTVTAKTRKRYATVHEH